VALAGERDQALVGLGRQQANRDSRAHRWIRIPFV
jgi:hypothetical protein